MKEPEFNSQYTELVKYLQSQENITEEQTDFILRKASFIANGAKLDLQNAINHTFQYAKFK